jgi:hypothetical protein
MWWDTIVIRAKVRAPTMGAVLGPGPGTPRRAAMVPTIEAAGCGDRARSAADEQARADLRRAMQAGEPVDEIFESFIGPLVEKAVPDAGGYVPLAQREEVLQVTVPGAHRPVRSGTRLCVRYRSDTVRYDGTRRHADHGDPLRLITRATATAGPGRRCTRTAPTRSAGWRAGAGEGVRLPSAGCGVIGAPAPRVERTKGGSRPAGSARRARRAPHGTRPHTVHVPPRGEGGVGSGLCRGQE